MTVILMAVDDTGPFCMNKGGGWGLSLLLHAEMQHTWGSRRASFWATARRDVQAQMQQCSYFNHQVLVSLERKIAKFACPLRHICCQFLVDLSACKNTRNFELIFMKFDISLKYVDESKFVTKCDWRRCTNTRSCVSAHLETACSRFNAAKNVSSKCKYKWKKFILNAVSPLVPRF
jgi:hypothetical protein